MHASDDVVKLARNFHDDICFSNGYGTKSLNTLPDSIYKNVPKLVSFTPKVELIVLGKYRIQYLCFFVCLFFILSLK